MDFLVAAGETSNTVHGKPTMQFVIGNTVMSIVMEVPNLNFDRRT